MQRKPYAVVNATVQVLISPLQIFLHDLEEDNSVGTELPGRWPHTLKYEALFVLRLICAVVVKPEPVL
jgi:hypothetical protein